MTAIPTLETERLLLRAFAPRDLDTYAEMLADAEVLRFVGDGKPATREEAWRSMAMMLGHWELRGYGRWAVEEKATGRLLGHVGLHNPEGWPGLEAGCLLARDAWGKGFADEAGRATIDFAFESLRVDRVISIIQVDNIASIRLAERLGERLLEQRKFRGKDVFIYGIDRPDAQEV